MRIIRLFGLIFLAALLLSCKKPDEIALGDAPVGKPEEVARIKEGSMFLRGYDGVRLNSLKLPSPYSDYVYVIKPGKHQLMGMNIQSGHVLMPSDLRCFSMEAELSAGVEYIIDEDKANDMALLRRADTKEIIAKGPKYEQKDAYVGPCNWGKTVQ